MDKGFNVVRKLDCVESTYWEHPIWNARRPYHEDMRMTVWDGEIYGISTIVYQAEKRYAQVAL